MTQPTPKFKFAPGVLEQLERDHTNEELQQILNDMQSKLDDGTLFTEAVTVDMDKLQREDPLEYELLIAQLERLDELEEQKFLN